MPSDSRPRAAGPDAALVLAAVALSAIEVRLWIALTHGAGLRDILAAHVLLVVVAGVWLLGPKARRTRYGPLLWMSIAAFGPCGGLGTLLAIGVERYRAPLATSLEQWHDSLYPPRGSAPDTGPVRPGAPAAVLPGREAVASFHDILSYGSVQERQATIALIAQRFDPAFAEALRAAPADEHNVIRVQAATAIAHLEKQFFQKTLQLEAVLARSPNDPAALLALARHQDDQAFAGLFDAARQQDCRDRAAGLYARYLEVRPNDAEVEFRLARLLLRAGRAAEAEPRFRRRLAAGDPMARLWWMECLFALGRYAELREAARSWTDRRLLADVRGAEEAVACWTPAGEGA